ncbi:ikappab kinase complex-associated protein, putative [Entamoeba dispar SAW760]|uniref:Ikappab kinase complex-associated protein, putative n=1 Tax=Entamoeba dispar (strain ATCC PRA-260 / SAW760) TaxID=370354 RepID=B0EG79_ENTDS|nr:ikappab kinase complex-associated protein, putative [Entamoeba dispar SAW760]EDR26456.1 ikappab kinase complex-associated protein, putative [Entamoeba dispar SAW760]|eukprot:EDR26456.1 ikappab kinase complex-associated protein, putative [Entamoeba dispar SAW760]
MFHLQVHSIEKKDIGLSNIKTISNLNTDDKEIYFYQDPFIYSYKTNGILTKLIIQNLPNNIYDIVYNADTSKLLFINEKGVYESSISNGIATLKINKEGIKRIKLSDDCNFILLISSSELLMYTPEFSFLNSFSIKDIIDVSFSSNTQYVVVLTKNEMIVLSTTFNIRNKIILSNPQCMSIRPSNEFITVATNNILNFIEENCNIYKTFNQPNEYQTKILIWNSTSQLLLQIVSTPFNDILIISCYCYGKLIPKYSKCFLSIRTTFWDEVNPMKFHIITSTNEHLIFNFLLPICSINNSIYNIIIHPNTYNNVSLTDLNKGIIPPPLCHISIPIQSTQYIYSKIINNEPYIIIIDLFNIIHILKYINNQINKINEIKCPVDYPTNICLISSFELFIIDSTNQTSIIININNGNNNKIKFTNLPSPIHSLTQINDILYFQLFNGIIITSKKITPNNYIINSELSLSQFIPEYSIVIFNNKIHSFSLFGHKLYDNNIEIGENVNSYFISNNYIFYTTLNHTLHAINIKQHSIFIRSIERGSSIISYVPNDTKLIFQMPRGNLEVIHPRGVILDIIIDLLKKKDYKQTFEIVRRHKINYNFIRDYAFNQILDDIPIIITQIGSADHINAFLLSLENGILDPPYSYYIENSFEDHTDQTKTIALTIRKYLIDSHFPCDFVTTYLATYLLLQPIDFAIVLKDLFNFNEQGKINGIKYLSTFFPINAIFKSALQTQSKKIARFVISYSSLDPKEYEEQINTLSLD